MGTVGGGSEGQARQARSSMLRRVKGQTSAGTDVLDDSTHFSAPGRRRLRTPNSKRRRLRLLRLGLASAAVAMGGILLFAFSLTRL